MRLREQYIFPGWSSVFFPAVKLPHWWAVPVIWRYFGNTAYRQSVTAEKRKTAYRQNITAVLHYRRKNTAIFWFYRFRQKSTANSIDTAKKYRQLSIPPTLDTAQKVPTLDTAQNVPPTLDIAQKLPPILDTAEKVPRTPDTAQKVPAFLFVFFLRSFWFRFLFGKLLCGREDGETPRYPPIHLPTPRSAWSSRTMSGLEGNPSATSSVVAGSATSRSVEAGSAASSDPG